MHVVLVLIFILQAITSSRKEALVLALKRPPHIRLQNVFDYCQSNGDVSADGIEAEKQKASSAVLHRNLSLEFPLVDQGRGNIPSPRGWPEGPRLISGTCGCMPGIRKSKSCPSGFEAACGCAVLCNNLLHHESVRGSVQQILVDSTNGVMSRAFIVKFWSVLHRLRLYSLNPAPFLVNIARLGGYGGCPEAGEAILPRDSTAAANAFHIPRQVPPWYHAWCSSGQGAMPSGEQILSPCSWGMFPRFHCALHTEARSRRTSQTRRMWKG